MAVLRSEQPRLPRRDPHKVRSFFTGHGDGLFFPVFFDPFYMRALFCTELWSFIGAKAKHVLWQQDKASVWNLSPAPIAPE